MKNIFKTFFALVTVTSLLVACNGDGKSSTADTAAVDSTSSIQSSADTTFKVDTAAVDSTKLTDTTLAPASGVDTLSKTITKKTVVKKTVTKNQ